MRLEGWNHIPRGYGATFDVRSAPWWLRLWFRTPFVDRFAYPVLVARGHGRLRAHPGTAPSDREPVTGGWLILDRDEWPPGSTGFLA
jgi:hypothetical protein